MVKANRLLLAEPSLEKQLQSQLEQITAPKGNGELLMRLNKFCIAELTGATKSYSFSQIEHYDDIQKKQLALYNTSTYKDGLYRSYEEFDLQTPSGGQAQLRKGDFLFTS